MQALGFRIGYGGYCSLYTLSPLHSFEIFAFLFGDRKRTLNNLYWSVNHLKQYIIPDHG